MAHDKVILFAYGKRENAFVTCNIDFEINTNEEKMFRINIENYVEKIEEDLRLNNFVFELGKFCGKNDYGSILFLLSIEVPGRLVFELPSSASLNPNHFNDLKDFLRITLGFEIIN